MGKNKTKQKVKHKEKPSSGKRRSSLMTEVNRLIDWPWITNNIQFLVFISVLGLFYIANTRNAEKLYTEVQQLKNEVKELRWDYTTKKARAEQLSRQSKIVELADKKGLALENINEIPKKLKLN